MNETIIMKKAGGFYTGICAAILCVTAAIVYGLSFSVITYKENLFNINICILLILSAVIGGALLIVKSTQNYAPVLLCFGSGISLLMYIRIVIWPVSDTIYGIEPFPYINVLIVCFALMLLSFILAEVSLYMKKNQEIS